MKKRLMLIPTLLFLTGCSMGSSPTGASSLLYSKDVVYHCYQNYGGSTGVVSFSEEYGIVFDGENVFSWEKRNGTETKTNPQPYKVDGDGNVILTAYLGNLHLIWGKITEGIFMTYPYSRQGSYPQVYVTESYYNTWLKTN